MANEISFRYNEENICMKSPTHLNALRAFESTARLGSFKAAADEIGVTPEAIGQLVRTLESYLDIQLFLRNRGGKRLTPTQEALIVLPSLSEAFRCLTGVTDRLKGLSKSGVLTLSSPPSVAAKWLVPILPAFLQEKPDIDVRLDITSRLLDLTIGEIDIAIRYGQRDESWSNLNVIELAQNEKLVPVCCPSLLKAHPEINEVSGMLRHTLIRDITMQDTDYPGWREWLNLTGYSEFEGAHFLEVNASLAAIEMAKLSQGVALVREFLVQNELSEGRLVRLFPEHSLSTKRGYFIITSQKPRAQVIAFTHWLQEKLKVQFN